MSELVTAVTNSLFSLLWIAAIGIKLSFAEHCGHLDSNLGGRGEEAASDDDEEIPPFAGPEEDSPTPTRGRSRASRSPAPGRSPPGRSPPPAPPAATSHPDEAAEARADEEAAEEDDDMKIEYIYLDKLRVKGETGKRDVVATFTTLPAGGDPSTYKPYVRSSHASGRYKAFYVTCLLDECMTSGRHRIKKAWQKRNPHLADRMEGELESKYQKKTEEADRGKREMKTAYIEMEEEGLFVLEQPLDPWRINLREAMTEEGRSLHEGKKISKACGTMTEAYSYVTFYLVDKPSYSTRHDPSVDLPVDSDESPSLRKRRAGPTKMDTGTRNSY